MFATKRGTSVAFYDHPRNVGFFVRFPI